MFLTSSLHSSFSVFPKLPVAVHLSLNSTSTPQHGSLRQPPKDVSSPTCLSPNHTFLAVSLQFLQPLLSPLPWACLCMVASVFTKRPFPQLDSLHHGLQVLLKGPLIRNLSPELLPPLLIFIHLIFLQQVSSLDMCIREPKLCLLLCLQ